MTTSCSGLECQCGIFLIAPICCDEDVTDNNIPPVKLNLSLTDDKGVAKSWCDPNGALMVGGTIWSINTESDAYDDEDYDGPEVEVVTVEGCDYWAVRTCSHPANYDSAQEAGDPYPGTYIQGDCPSQYVLSGSILGQSIGTIEYTIDASGAYTLVDGCINLKQVQLINQGVTPPNDVCAALALCMCEALELAGFLIDTGDAYIKVDKTDACNWSITLDVDALEADLDINPGDDLTTAELCALMATITAANPGESVGGVVAFNGAGVCKGYTAEAFLCALIGTLSAGTPVNVVGTDANGACVVGPLQAGGGTPTLAQLCAVLNTATVATGPPAFLFGFDGNGGCNKYPVGNQIVEWDGTGDCPPLPDNPLLPAIAVDKSDPTVSAVPYIFCPASYAAGGSNDPCDGWKPSPSCTPTLRVEAPSCDVPPNTIPANAIPGTTAYVYTAVGAAITASPAWLLDDFGNGLVWVKLDNCACCDEDPGNGLCTYTLETVECTGVAGGLKFSQWQGADSATIISVNESNSPVDPSFIWSEGFTAPGGTHANAGAPTILGTGSPSTQYISPNIGANDPPTESQQVEWSGWFMSPIPNPTFSDTQGGADAHAIIIDGVVLASNVDYDQNAGASDLVGTAQAGASSSCCVDGATEYLFQIAYRGHNRRNQMVLRLDVDLGNGPEELPLDRLYEDKPTETITSTRDITIPCDDDPAAQLQACERVKP